jgi:hypothetical protein
MLSVLCAQPVDGSAEVICVEMSLPAVEKHGASAPFDKFRVDLFHAFVWGLVRCQTTSKPVGGKRQPRAWMSGASGLSSKKLWVSTTIGLNRAY